MINSFSQKLSTRVTVKSNISTIINFLLLTSVTSLTAITMCSAFTPDCGDDNSTIIVLGVVYCPTCRKEKCAYTSTKKWLGFTTVTSVKPVLTFWIFLLRTRNRQLCCLAVIVHIVLQEKRVAPAKKKNHLQFWRNFSANQFQANANPHQKWLNRVQKSSKRIHFLLADDIWATYSFLKSFRSLSTYKQPLKFLQLAVNLRKILIFSVSNNRLQWTLDFGPDSVAIAVNDLVQNITIR